ncbi:MAG: hypothetical protein EAX96_00810 [Candidatus Lokiarchaeota archaeon]|nr:hypothetical protein [Candidatus Lokiarchaeota archaeon]
MVISSTAEYNTIVTMLGALCATVQIMTGFFAFYYKKKKFMLKSNEILFRSHRAFGSFATVFYFLGLFAGLTGFIGAITVNSPPFEFWDLSFIVHTWPSFAVIVVLVAKTYLSYFKKQTLYKRAGWLGVATFIAWAFTWITAGISYYLRTIPTNPQHPPPSFLLPFPIFPLQIALPFIIGAIIGTLILWRANINEIEKLAKKSE